jgi:hypothetical protein
MLMRHLLATLVCSVAISSAAVAEVEKIAIPGARGMTLHWWPKVAPVAGWHHDREHSLHYGVNAWAPDGFTFADAETVMYARAIYKPRDPAVKSLADLIARDKKDFLEKSPTLVIAEAGPLTTADGKRLTSLTFFPKDSGNWERVTYGEEGEFFLLFTVSSRSLAGYKAAMNAYEHMVKRYKEKP